MSSLPNIPAPQGGAGAAAPNPRAAPQARPHAAPPAGLHTISAGPATATQTPPRPAEPSQVPLTHNTAEGEVQGVFVSDEQFMHDYFKESHTLPTVVLIVCAGLTVAIFGAGGLIGGGAAGAIGAVVFALFLLAGGALTATGAGWVVAKVLGEDYGSVGVLLLRFSAVASAQFPVLLGLNMAVGPILALFVAVPVMLFVTMFVAGMGIVRAFFFMCVLAIAEWMLFAFLAMSLATAFID